MADKSFMEFVQDSQQTTLVLKGESSEKRYIKHFTPNGYQIIFAQRLDKTEGFFMVNNYACVCIADSKGNIMAANMMSHITGQKFLVGDIQPIENIRAKLSNALARALFPDVLLYMNKYLPKESENTLSTINTNYLLAFHPDRPFNENFTNSKITCSGGCITLGDIICGLMKKYNPERHAQQILSVLASGHELQQGDDRLVSELLTLYTDYETISGILGTELKRSIMVKNAIYDQLPRKPRSGYIEYETPDGLLMKVDFRNISFEEETTLAEYWLGFFLNAGSITQAIENEKKKGAILVRSSSWNLLPWYRIKRVVYLKKTIFQA